MTGAGVPAALTVLCDQAAPLVPGVIYTARSRTVALKQIIAYNTGSQGAQLHLYLVRRTDVPTIGITPPGDRAQRLARGLEIAPGAVHELLGVTPLGYEIMFCGDVLYGEQSRPDAITLLAYGARTG